VFRMVRSRS